MRDVVRQISLNEVAKKIHTPSATPSEFEEESVYEILLAADSWHKLLQIILLRLLFPDIRLSQYITLKYMDFS